MRGVAWVISRMLILSILVVALPSCEQLGDSENDKASSDVPVPEQATDAPEVAEPRSAAPADVYAGVSSTEDLLATVPEVDRKIVESFYGRYDVAADIDNHAQLQWMLEHGYPMPKDIVAAQRLTDSELLALYESGDLEAGTFYLERKAYPSGEDAQIPRAERARLDELASDILFSGSPFSGYVYARYQAESNGDPHRALAGYAWANWRGDLRAAEAMVRAEYRLSEMYPQTPLQPSVAVIAFATLLQTARSRNPALLAASVQPIPFDYQQ